MKYTIKKGNHYHSNLIMRLWMIIAMFPRKVVKYKVKFTKEAWYNKNVVIHSGYNKLFGAGAINHHIRSARFVWQPDFNNENRFRISTYVYEKGKWKARYVCTISADIEYEMKIEKNNNGYIFTCNGEKHLVEHKHPTLFRLLQPYHGGKDVAYHTYSIYLNKL